MKTPIQRSKLRLFLGRCFFTTKRNLFWHSPGKKFAKHSDKKLSINIFSHKTILKRKLKDVDAWIQENKITNLHLAIQKLDRILIKPGETFCFWRQVGKPTKKKGYVDGMILHNGKVGTGIGGGLCQLTNLLYWMTLHTPLTVTERWRHSYDVFPDVRRKQPFGSGATCAYPNIDLQIKNNTDRPFQLSLSLTKTHLVGNWLSDRETRFNYEIEEKDHLIKGEWSGAYSRNNKLFRKVIDKKTGKCLKEEFITENHALMMYEPLLENKI